MASSQISSSLNLTTPPYTLQRQGLGEVPSLLPDVPINSVFLSLFLMGAVAHMALFQYNLRRSRKFVFSAATCGFCITRVIAATLRAAWAGNQSNISLPMAAQIFVYAGAIILIITNLFWTVRFVRAQHPYFGWSKPFSLWLPLWIILCGITMICLVISIVVQFYILGASSHRAARQLELFGAALFAVSALLPIPILTVSCVAKTHPSLKDRPVDNFGIGQSSLTHKLCIIILTSVLLSISAVFRAATTLVNPAPISASTPWYFSRACFYIFNFSVEFLIITFWLTSRVDKHFLIPDDCYGPMSYGIAFLFPHRRSSSRSYGGSTLPPPSRAGSWGGTLRNYMTDDDDDEKASPCRLKTPISRLQTPTIDHDDRPRHPEMIFKGPDTRYFTRRSRGNSFWNSSATATQQTPSQRADSAYESSRAKPVEGGDTEDMRNFPLAMNSIDLRRAAAAALRAAAAEQEAAILARMNRQARWQERWQDRQERSMDERRSMSMYSCRTDLQAYTPRI